MLQKYADRRKAAGLCLKCGNPVGREGYVTCAECGRKTATQNKLWRDLLRSRGYCIVCGKVKVEEPYRTCLACREYNRKAKERSRAREVAVNG